MNSLIAIFTGAMLVFQLISFHVEAAGPTKIEGTVTNTSGEPVPYATAELIKSNDSTFVSAAVTDMEGSYLIENIPFGKYLIRLSCLGFQKKIISEFALTAKDSSIRFGPAILEEETQLLGEVTVLAQNLTGRIDEDKIVYPISSKVAEYVHSGLELLRQLPDISVNYMTDEIKLAGSNNIRFQVNGRKVDQSYLLQLNPGLVDKIEVLTNPGAKYDSGVDAVINLVLKKNVVQGLSGRMRLQIPVSEALLTKNNISVDFYYQKFRLYTGGNYKYGHYKIENNNERISSPAGSEPSTLTRQARSRVVNQSAGFNYGIDWFPDEKNSLSFAGSYQPALPGKTDQISDNIWRINPDVSNTTGYHKIRDKNAYYDYSLYYKLQFDKKFHELSIENYLSNRNARLDDGYSEYRASPEELLSRMDQHKDTWNRQFLIRIDYSYPLSEKIKFTSGYNGFFIRSKYAYEEWVALFSDALRYHENRQVGYSNISLNHGGLNLQFGGRYEFSSVRINHQTDQMSRYHMWFPSASVQYNVVDKHSFRLNYRKSAIRPDVVQLSPIRYAEDAYSELIGNPKLKPASIHRFEFTHRIQLNKLSTISYIPYLTFVRDDIRQVVTEEEENSTVLSRKYVNIGDDLEFGLTLSVSVNLADWWTVSPSFTYFRRELEAVPEYGINQSFRRSSFRSNVSSQWVLSKSWMAFAECNFYGRSINIQTTMHPTYECMIGLNKMVSKKLSISVFTLNPWKNRYVIDKHTLSTPELSEVSEEALKYNYLFYFSVGYKFSRGKEGKQLHRPHQPEEIRKSSGGIF